MNDGASESADQAAGGDARRAWLQTALGVDIAGHRNTASPSGGTPSGRVPDATSTDLFFDQDSCELTDSDRRSLAAYAAAYSTGKSAEPIVIEAFASEEGESGHNLDLSKRRARAVADFLIKHGIAQDKVSATGRGATTGFSKADLRQNRRATIKPPPPSAGASTAPPPAGTGSAPSGDGSPMPHDLGMRGPEDAPRPGSPSRPVGLPRLDRDAGERIVGQDTGVPRDRVERALKDFLEKLAAGQKAKTLKATGRAQVAEFTLRRDLPGEPFVKNGDQKDYPPDDLAAKIASDLPERIPAANFTAFLKMKPIEERKPGSVTDQLHRKYEEERDKLVKKLPKSLQDAAKKAIDAAVEKGIPFLAEQVLGGLPSSVKDEAQKFVDEYTKKITGGSDDGSN
ncbi:MAG TPA: OmpA family protein [Roseiarcus sp.]|nr:OmpA family protein [Roseiarcus sp.]